MSKVFDRLYPEMRAGGYDRDDQVAQFFFRLHSLIRPEMTVVDFGAGRGLIYEAPPSYRRDLKILKGKVAKVIGADVDPAVLTNKAVDEACVIGLDGRIPLPDASVDLIFSSATFEHVEHPDRVERELYRILKPGGWVCAWTVNKWGYVALVARLVPNRYHAFFVKVSDPDSPRRSEDVFPTCYRLNTLRDVGKHFGGDRWVNCSYYLPGHPSYHAGSVLMARIWNIYNKTVPGFLQKNLHVFVQKK